MKGGSFYILKKLIKYRGGYHERKKFYEKIKDWNFDKFNIESENLTNFDMYEILKDVTNKDSKILDLGTGGGEKLLKCFPNEKDYHIKIHPKFDSHRLCTLPF